MKTLAQIIWNVSEYTGIGLGKFAPYIFGAMIGAKPQGMSLYACKKCKATSYGYGPGFPRYCGHCS